MDYVLLYRLADGRVDGMREADGTLVALTRDSAIEWLLENQMGKDVVAYQAVPLDEL